MTAPLDFVFKPFEQMTAADYAAIGFKSGLEIHQQLLTRRKLFCRCPAGRYSESYDAEILRHMRPTLSELGEYDGTALMEFKTKKEIVYLLNKESVCTYEMDDAPPFEPDPQAIEIALEVALLLKLNLVSELHISRKQYLDGSIPTGFQRTTILGMDGEIVVKGRVIPIIQLGLEEDACREVSDQGHRRVYRTDRLGMPLIETVTYPVMKTPQEVAEVAQVIREMVRMTGKVRTGHGAAREDVNVSIDGGTRIEIKGVPSIKRIPRIVYNEAMRQHNLLKIRALLHARGITPESFTFTSADVTGILRSTSFLPINQGIARGSVVSAVCLPKFRGVLAHPTQENVYFIQEIMDRVRVIACLMDHPNLLHTDSTDSGISRGQWNKIHKRLSSGPEDTIILVWGSPEDVATAIREIGIRAREATQGIPSETRQAFRDGTNGFERILPGPDRMYPDTDEPPIPLEDEMIERIRSGLPPTPWAWRDELGTAGISDSVAERIVKQGFSRLFTAMLRRLPEQKTLLLQLFTRDFPHWRRRRLSVERLTEETLTGLFEELKAGRLLPEAIHYACLDILKGRSLEDVIAAYRVDPSAAPTLAALKGKIALEQNGLISKLKRARLAHYMGSVLGEIRGKIPAQAVEQELSKVVHGDE